jgi:hypothetical protein
MLRILGLAILLSAGLAQAEEARVASDRSVQSEQPVRKGFHPVKAIRRLHDRFVNMAIDLSSIGIDQPADPPASATLLSAANHPACTNVQLTAMLLPNVSQSIPR